MMAKNMPRQQKRSFSYGQQRAFRGLEEAAIQRRLVKARRLLDLVVSKRPGKQLDVLELGCGFWGRNLAGLQPDYLNVKFTGVDLSVSKNVAGIHLIQADLSVWQPEQTYDVVLSLAVVEHLLAPAAHFALIAKSLKKDGQAGLTTPTPQADLVLRMLGKLGIFDREEIEDHKLYLTQNGLESLAGQAGLAVEENYTFSLGMNQWMLTRKA